MRNWSWFERLQPTGSVNTGLPLMPPRSDGQAALARPRAASRDTRLSQGMSSSPASTVCSSPRKPFLSLSCSPFSLRQVSNVFMKRLHLRLPSPEAAWWAYQPWPWEHFLAMSSDIYSLEKCKGNIFLADSSLSNEVAIIIFQRWILSVKNVP